MTRTLDASWQCHRRTIPTPRKFRRVIRDAHERGAKVSRRADGRYLIDDLPVIAFLPHRRRSRLAVRNGVGQAAWV